MSSVRLSKRLVYFTIGYTLFCGFAIKNLNFGKSCLFLVDILCLLILIRDNFKLKKTNLFGTIPIIIFLMLSLLIGAGINSVSIPNFIWGLRNQYIALPLFFASASFLCLQDIHKLFRIFFYFQILNLICALYQYLVLGYYQDLNNGAFINGNGQDIFCGVLVTYYFYQYINHNCKLRPFIFILFSSLVIAALEEEKFIFIEIAIIFTYYFITSGNISIKKILLAITFSLMLIIGLSILAEVNGEGSVEVLTNKDAFMNYQENAFTLPRIGSSQVISEMFFKHDYQELFGFGLGNCEESSTLSFIDATFYNQYGWLRYNWFTFQINFLQTGWLGIILFLSFFTYILWSNIYNRHKSPDKLKHYYDISIVIIILCVITIWYNGTLRGYNSPFPFFALTIGNIITRQFVNKNIVKRDVI